MTSQDLLPDEFTLLFPLDSGSAGPASRSVSMDLPPYAGFNWTLGKPGVPAPTYDKALDHALGLQGELREATATMRDLQHDAMTASTRANELAIDLADAEDELETAWDRVRSLTGELGDTKHDLEMAKAQAGGWDEIGTGAGSTLLLGLVAMLIKNQIGKKEG